MSSRRNVPSIMEIPAYIGHLLAWLVITSILIRHCGGCVTGCQCSMAGSSKRQKGRRVDCVQHAAPFRTLADVTFPPDTIHLNLAHNELVILQQASFIELSGLQKLNLSSNQITVIESGAFDGLQSLKKLDLSRNQVAVVNSNMFSGLPKLEKLYLAHNRISVIPDGTLNDLRSLKRIEFGSDYLRCDCHLKWILKWAKKRHVRISGSTACAMPAKLKGQSLSKLKPTELHCDHKIQQPIFDIRPSESQLVFQGDKLPFECHASVTPGTMEIAWFRGGQLVTTNKTIGVFVHTSHNLDHTVINHRLVVESLDSSHAGEWSCVVTTLAGNLTKTVHVEVRKPEVEFECPVVTNRTAKGIYTWNASMGGLLVSQPCQRGEKGAMATHKCGLDGRWKNLNTSACSFLKDITRKLARYSKSDPATVDIPTLIYGMNKALVAAAQNGESLDSFDILYISKVMDILLPHATTNTGVASLLVNLVSNVSSLPPRVVEMIHMESRSPLRMVQMLEQMGEDIISHTQDQEWKIFSENIAVVVLGHQMLKNGISCALLGSEESLEHGFTGTNFHCSSVVTESNPHVYVHIPFLRAGNSQDQMVSLKFTTVSPVYDEVLMVNTSDFGKSNPDDSLNGSVSVNETSALLLDPALASSDDADMDPLEANSDLEMGMFPVGPQDMKTSQSSSAFPPLAFNDNQLEALNLSSHYFSKFSKPLNISSKTLLSLPSSLDVSARHLFPFVKNSVTASPVTQLPHHNNMYLIMYRNGRLFPVIQSDLSDGAFRKGNWAVVTPVIAVSSGGRTQNLSQPVMVTFTVSDTRRPLRAAYFDFETMNGYGGWKTDGCEIVLQNGSIITVRIHHLSNFALLQDLSFMFRLASFPLEPVIFVGSGICILCMVVVFVTFSTYFSSIGIPKKIKHAVMNVCLSTLFLMVIFVFGINRTEVELPCQIIGICIHYLTLCTVFWITVTTNILYKKFLKASRPPEPPPDLIMMPLPPKPILQFYFVGYGVPVIICGITAAVNLSFYAGLQYCFLDWEPSLGAFYVPVALLVAWNLALFLRISCIVKSISEVESEACNENDNEIHTNEIEIMPSQPDTIISTTRKISFKANNGVNNSGASAGGHHGRYSRASSEKDDEEDIVSTTSIPDQERSRIAQLRSLVAILFLFLAMWMCGALAVAKPFHHFIPHSEIIFSYIYGLMSSLFGAFMVVYFCITRKDSWETWKDATKCASPEEVIVPVEITEKPAEPPTVSQPVHNGTIVKSNSSSNLSVNSQKSSNITRAYNMKNISNSKQSNINLILPNSSDTSYGSAQENFPNFYNARQNGAAKKFWHKHRHHSKILNKDINRELHSSLTDNSAVEQSNRLSNDTSSDANTHLSIEIQIQAKEGSFTGSKEIPVHINNYQQVHSQNILGSSSGNESIEPSTLLSKMSAAAGVNQTLFDGNLQSGESVSQLAQYQQSASSGVHHSAFTPIQPRSNTAMSKLGRAEVEGEDLMKPNIGKREEMEPRNQLSGSPSQATTGQSQDSDAGQRPANPGVAWNPRHCNLPPLSNHSAAFSFTPPPQPPPPPPPAHCQQHYPFDFGVYSPSVSVSPHVFNINQTAPLTGKSPASLMQQHGHPPSFNIPPSPYLIQSQTRDTVQPMSLESSSSQSQSNCKQSSSDSSYPVSGGDSSDSGRPRKKLTFSADNPGRTVTFNPHSPILSDSQAYESSCQSNESNDQQGTNKNRPMESDHHSDPTHRKKPSRFERHCSRNKLTNKQRSLGWDEQFKDRPSKVHYVYVNHQYKDKVMQKLIKQASESDDLAKQAFWLPRSASEYERLRQRGFCNMADDSSSSSCEDDSLDDNVWIRQSVGSNFCKKETSV